MREELMTEENQFVVFTLAGESYGVDINRVREIITMQSITLLPGRMEFIEGIINLRGNVIPVYNLRKKFGLQETETSDSTRIMVVDLENNVLGIVVDGVSEVMRISGKHIEEPTAAVTSNISADYFKGIAKLDNKMVIILDLQKALVIDVGLLLEA